MHGAFLPSPMHQPCVYLLHPPLPNVPFRSLSPPSHPHQPAEDQRSMRLLILGELMGCADFERDRLYAEWVGYCADFEWGTLCGTGYAQSKWGEGAGS